MLKRLRALLASPVFLNDEAKNFTASLLNPILLFVIAGAVLYGLVSPLPANIGPARFLYALAFVGLGLGLQLILRRGHVRLAAWLLVAGLWGLLTLTAALNGGVLSQAFPGYIIVTLCAGLLLGERAGLAWAVASGLTGVGFLWADRLGWLPAAGVIHTRESLWLVQVIYFLAAAILLGFTWRTITRALRQARQALTEQEATEARYRALVEQMPAVSYVMAADLSGRLRYVSPQIEALLGMTPAARLEMSFAAWLEWLSPAEGEALRAALQRLFETGQPQEIEYRVLKPAAPPVWLRDQMALARDAAGRPTAIQGFLFDITARRQAEAALQEARSFLQQVVDTFPGIIFVKDRQGQVVFANRFAADHDSALLETRPTSFTAGAPPQAAEGPGQISDDQLVLDTGRLIVRDEIYTAPEGAPRWFQTVKVPLVRSEGEVAVLSIGTDITDRKQAEAEIHAQIERVSALYEITRDLVVEHDLNNLLRTIVERAARLLNAGGGGLYLCEPAERQVRCVVSYNTRQDYTGIVLRYGEGAAGRVAETGEPLIVEDYGLWEGRAQSFEQDRPFQAVLSMPIKWQAELIGVLHVLEFERTRVFTPADQALVASFANQAALAVQNARLYLRLQTELDQRQTTQLALQENQAQLAGIIESAMDAIITIDDQQRILIINAAAEQTFGAQAEAVRGERLDRFLPARFREAHQRHVRAFGETGKTSRTMGRPAKLLAQRASGEEFPIEASISQTEVNGRRLFTVILRDITAREETEARLRQLSLAVEQSPASIIITDLTGAIQYVNPKFTQVSGYPLEEVVGQNARLLKSGLTPPGTYAPLWQAITAGHEWRGEFYNRRKNGELYWESASVSPVFDARGVIVNYLSVQEDITERKRIQAALTAANAELQLMVAQARQLAEEAQTASRLKSEFLASISHELRTPLTGLLGSLNLILDDVCASPEEERAFVRLARQAAEQQLRLVNNLLTMARLEAGQVRVELQNVELPEVLSTIVSIFRAATDSLGLEMLPAPEPAPVVWANREALHQVLVNVLSNAIKFTRQGRVRVGAQVEAGEAGQPARLALSIQDTGVGIALDKQRHLLEPFVQADGSTTRRFGGAGLGLSIARNLAELMGGSLTIASTGEGQGTTVTIRLRTAPVD